MGSKSTTTQNSQPYKPAQPMLNAGLQDAQRLYQSGGFTQSPFGGDMVANWDGLQQQAYGAAPGLTQGAMANNNNALGFLNTALDPNQQSNTFQQTVNNRIAQVMPQINSSFAGSGMAGSGLHAQNLSAGVSQGVADVYNQNWQGNQNRAMAAAGMIPGLNNANFAANDYMFGMGGQAQEQNQNEINANILRDQQSKSMNAQALQDYLALVSGVSAPFGVQSSTQKQSPGIMGILGAGLQAAPLMFSDKRLKENIEKVGKLDNGLGVYRYNYKDGGPTHIGVMAQEVEKVKPQAVKTVLGFKAVDYGAI